MNLNKNTNTWEIESRSVTQPVYTFWFGQDQKQSWQKGQIVLKRCNLVYRYCKYWSYNGSIMMNIFWREKPDHTHVSNAVGLSVRLTVCLSVCQPPLNSCQYVYLISIYLNLFCFECQFLYLSIEYIDRVRLNIWRS